jgi:hypothetical protein
MAACSQQMTGQLRLQHGIDAPIDDGVVAQFAGQPVRERGNLGMVQPQGWIG